MYWLTIILVEFDLYEGQHLTISFFTSFDKIIIMKNDAARASILGAKFYA